MKLLNTEHDRDTKQLHIKYFLVEIFYIFLIEKHLDMTIVLTSIFLL